MTAFASAPDTGKESSRGQSLQSTLTARVSNMSNVVCEKCACEIPGEEAMVAVPAARLYSYRARAEAAEAKLNDIDVIQRPSPDRPANEAQLLRFGIL